jgi:hypothetical protein
MGCSNADNPSSVSTANTTADATKYASDNQVIISRIATAASLIMAALQYKTWQDQIDKQDKIAQRIQDRADELHGVWSGSYLPCELATLSEICSEPKRVADLNLVAQRAIAEVSKRFSVARKKALYCMPANCVGASCEIETRMAVDQARSEAWQAQASMRAEEARIDVINAQRLNNRINIIATGRNGTSQASSALSAAAGIYGKLAEQAAGAFNGAIATAGRFAAMSANGAPGGMNIGVMNTSTMGNFDGVNTSVRDTFRRGEYDNGTMTQDSFRRSELNDTNYGPSSIPQPVGPNGSLTSAGVYTEKLLDDTVYNTKLTP